MDTADSSHLSLVTIAAGLLLAVGYLLVQQAYPRPIPGIPYEQAATKRIFGDISEIGEYLRKAESFRTWFLDQAHKHNSAITKVCLGPFSKPAIIVSDYLEVNDTLNHRDAVDFKRGLKVDGFRGLLLHAFPAHGDIRPQFLQ
jgi:hypothetical protein